MCETGYYRFDLDNVNIIQIRTHYHVGRDVRTCWILQINTISPTG